MDNKRLTALDSRIQEVRTLLGELEDASRQIREQNQHEAVDHIEDYLDSSDEALGQLSLFKEEVVIEIKTLVEKMKGLLRR
ncbi:MAG: hypothetical protein ACR2PT_18925 [Endozoicomonas sp.]